MITINLPVVDSIKGAIADLTYMSESDFPFEVHSYPLQDIESLLFKLCQVTKSESLEKETLTYFFRNQVKVYPEFSQTDKQRAERFIQLQQLLEEKLSDIVVYRIGSINVKAYIVGRFDDVIILIGTTVIET